MSPSPIYHECERAFGRPSLDPCWHPNSPIRPFYAFSRHCRVGEWRDPRTGVVVSVVGRNGLSTTVLWSEYKGWKWLNPPYSGPEPWLERVMVHKESVCLIKHDPSTEWWEGSIWPMSEPRAVGLFHDRLHYPDADMLTDPNQAMFPSAIVVKGLDHTKLRLKRITWITSWRTVA